MSENSVLFNCVIGAACLATIYVLFGPSQSKTSNYVYNKKEKKAFRIWGLENNDNNCYINVVVQALCSSESFIVWLRESLVQQKLFSPNLLINNQQRTAIQFIQYLFSIIFGQNFSHNQINSSEYQSIEFAAEKTLTFQLLKLLQEVNGQSSDLNVSPNANKLLELLYNFNFNSRNEQQDAHELFNVLTSSLETEIFRTMSTEDYSMNGIQKNGLHNNRQVNCISENNQTVDMHNLASSSKRSDVIDSSNIDQRQSSNNTAIFSRELSKNYDVIKKSLNLKRNLPTKGLLAHQIRCLRCDHKFTIQFESFHSISLPIPTAKNFNEPITLKDCLDAFVSSEVLKDVLCENCQKLNGNDKTLPIKKSTFAKHLTFAKLPQMLVIHFKSLVLNSNGILIKKDDRVKFPRTLIMDDYQYENNAMNNSSSTMLDEICLNSGEKASNYSKSPTNQNESQQMNRNDIQKNLFDSIHPLTSEIENSRFSHDVDSEAAFFSPSMNGEKDVKTSFGQLVDETTVNSIPIIDNHLVSCHSGDNIIECNKLDNDEEDESKIVNGDANLSATQSETVSAKVSMTSKATEDNGAQNGHKIPDSTVISANETSVANAYSLFEQSNKMSSNSIKSNKESLTTSPKTVSTKALSAKQKNSKYAYTLSACIVHFGSSFGGHYVNHRRLPNSSPINAGDWYFTNDTIVRQSSVEKALSSNAYMLFYERIQNDCNK